MSDHDHGQDTPGTALTWGLLGDVRYRPDLEVFSAQPWLEGGYRIVAYNHDFSGTSALDLQLRGPLLGVGFAF